MDGYSFSYCLFKGFEGRRNKETAMPVCGSKGRSSSLFLHVEAALSVSTPTRD